MQNITYHYTTSKPPKVSLRGKGMSDPAAQAFVKSKGFKWIYRKVRKMVVAWQAEMPVYSLIEVLLSLKKMGHNVVPSDNLSPTRYLYLDEPKEVVTTEFRTFQEYGFDNLVKWLVDNGYMELGAVEEPGDFAVIGEVIIVWTRDNDALYRFIFNGNTIESIGKVDPSKTVTEAVTVATIPNVVFRVEVEQVVKVPRKRQKKQRFIRKKDTCVSTTEIEGFEGEEPTDIFDQLQSVADVEPVETEATIVEEPRKYTPSQARLLVKRFPQIDKEHPLYKMVDWK